MNNNENKNIGLLILWDRLCFLGDEKMLKMHYIRQKSGVTSPNVSNLDKQNAYLAN